ncbi:zinc metallopeptidase [Shimazuella kribbensis]|uniref:zinc metallopeptidase n=1 Tax=Shimazuella kribbensis TaxID=139808 RepID=UPI00041E6C6C|nr:zinc metallopeptidase [Shimazuella kribbensis]
MFFALDIIVMILAVVITLYAQIKVKNAFHTWSGVATRSGYTGFEVARQILDQNDLQHVAVEPIRGNFSDHYDPSVKVIRLSEAVYAKSSVAAVSVAAHECGHALQHQEDYGALVIRHRLVPFLNFTSGAAPILLLIGFFLQLSNLILVGIVFYLVTVVFHLVTLPVEFNASSRAKQIIFSEGIIARDEENGVQKVLNAAAFTYVAGALVALIELGRFIFLYVLSQNNER